MLPFIRGEERNYYIEKKVRVAQLLYSPFSCLLHINPLCCCLWDSICVRPKFLKAFLLVGAYTLLNHALKLHVYFPCLSEIRSSSRSLVDPFCSKASSSQLRDFLISNVSHALSMRLIICATFSEAALSGLRGIYIAESAFSVEH